MNSQLKKIAVAQIFFALATSTLLCELGRADTPLKAEEVAFFEAKVRPILVERCYKCHSDQSEDVKGGLRLDTRDGSRAGGDSGPAVVPREPGKSLILSAIRYEGLEMPPDSRLSEDEIANIERWIRLGAADPRDGPSRSTKSGINVGKARQFWSFQPVGEPPLPTVQSLNRSSTPVDRFILAKLEQKGLTGSEPANRRDMIRRVTFDLLGLPPTPDEVDAYVADDSPDAYERLVDRLLASPRYGERWGQHWLDVVRFAETEGFEYDRTVPGAWRFRDYVINSLNSGIAYDDFLREQIAGDEMGPTQPDKLAAATFHRLGPVRRNAGNQEVAGSRNEVLTERTDIIGSAFLGLTIGCARCHDHKFDPISQRDYYSMQAYFAASHEFEFPMVGQDIYQAWQAKTKSIQTKIDGLKKALAMQMGAEEAATRAKIEELEKELPEIVPVISSVRNDFDNQTPIHVLKRGEWSLPGDKAVPSPMEILRSIGPAESVDTSLPRTGLANWLTNVANPLTPRVIANRLWHFHLGRGIVPSPNDFGQNGQRPSHIELLDYLASRLLDHQWQIKPIQRMILLSDTYRQTSEISDGHPGALVDPQNTWLWRFNKRRLSAEEIRDSMLAVSGQLNFEAGGPSIMLPVEKPLIDQLYKTSQWQVAADPGQHARRSVYLIAKRNLRLPFMEVFDQPTLQASCARREASTHAPQALEMLNGRIANEMAGAFAERLLRSAGADTLRTVDFAFQFASGRPPTAEELRLGVEFLRDGSAREFALAMFNLNAFLYVR